MKFECKTCRLIANQKDFILASRSSDNSPLLPFCSKGCLEIWGCGDWKLIHQLRENRKKEEATQNE